MAETADLTAGNQAFYTTSYALGTGTTYTIALQIWRALSDHLLLHRKPMSGPDLAGQMGMSVDQIDKIFGQTYYQKHYGFRRFDSLEEWTDWAESSGLLDVPDPDDFFDEDSLGDEDDVEAKA